METKKEINEDRKLELLLEHLDIKLSNEYGDILDSAISLYPETTSDGYEVFVLDYGYNNGSPNIGESVYSYESNAIKELVKEFDYHSHELIYIDVDMMSDFDVEMEILSEYFHKHVKRIVSSKNTRISQLEIDALKREYEEEFSADEQV
jgi:hypothetical protein